MEFLKIDNLDALWSAMNLYKQMIDENDLSKEKEMYNLSLVIEDGLKRLEPNNSMYDSSLSQITKPTTQPDYPRNIEQLKAIPEGTTRFLPDEIEGLDLRGKDLLTALMQFYNIHKIKDLASATNINISSLSRVLSGHRQISAGMAVSLGDLFKYPSHRFMAK